jgi:hypothetical protein
VRRYYEYPQAGEASWVGCTAIEQQNDRFLFLGGKGSNLALLETQNLFFPAIQIQPLGTVPRMQALVFDPNGDVTLMMSERDYVNRESESGDSLDQEVFQKESEPDDGLDKEIV